MEVFGQAASEERNINGLLLAVRRADASAARGKVTVQIDYSQFAGAFGGDWATRLRIYQYPACFITTPGLAACQTATALPTSNEPKLFTLTADTGVGGAVNTAVLAVQAAPSGDNGSFGATALSQAGAWHVGEQTGDFSWSYPLRMPPAPGGPSPAFGLGYSSGSIDGRTSTSNNQGGWIGDGWDAWPGFIERKYASCSDDNPSHPTGDQCWSTSNATLSLSGHAGELIETGTPNVWRLRKDDGTRIERLSDAARGNGDNDNEYWKVTTIDGGQYFFGLHRLPNWAAGNPVTDSVWTVPVYGNNPGEPCYDPTFANAWCPSTAGQAWRWNLDYAVDTHGNSMSYFYSKETGWYGRNNTPSQRTSYVRGGWLDRIEYGTRSGSEYAAAAPLKVTFETAERCLSGCWAGAPWQSAPVPSAWPDTPLDQDCTASPCTGMTAPTFWSARRLQKAVTSVRSGASTYRPVESWALRHEFLNAGDNEGAPMWLRGITRTGHVTTAGGVQAADPEIVFDPGAEPMPNRVDGPADSRTSLTRFRIKTVSNESGGQIVVTYSGHDCTAATLPSPASNNKRCFPSFYAPTGTPTLDWFHKYVVKEVKLVDRTTEGTSAAHNEDQIIFYDYLDDPAWHYTDDEITPEKYKTWSDWRGYGRVQVRKGATLGLQTAVETRYLRGMDGDRQQSGSRDVWVPDTWGGTIEDQDSLNGYVLQTITFNGPGGTEVSSGVNTPWVHGPVATRTRNGVTTSSFMVKTGTARTRHPLAAAGTRTVKTINAFNTDGLITSSETHGDENVTGDETCTKTLYARNDTTWQIDKISQVEQLSGLCPAGQAPQATVLSRSRLFYDTYTGESSFGSPPGAGDVVRTEALGSWNGTAPVYAATATTTYDTAGRITVTANAHGHKVTSAYITDPSTGLVKTTTVTNELGHVSTLTSEPAWQQPTQTVDENGIVTDLTYDGLGRLTQVWLPGRSKTAQTPSIRYSYLVRASGGPSVVTTETLLHTGAGYRKSATLYDGFFLVRQTQNQATGGGRQLTDTLYNSRGEMDWIASPYYDSTNTAVGTALGVPASTVPAVVRRTYDGAGRPTTETFLDNGIAKFSTVTQYQGERTTITPPAGGTVSATVTDATGRTSQLWQYKNRLDAGSTDPSKFDTTRYEYNLAGKMSKLTDPAGNQWTYKYDLRGRQYEAKDPDKGTTTKTFDAEGQIRAITSPLGTSTTTIAFTYDKLGRKTEARQDHEQGTLLASWVYDQTPIMPGGTAKAKGKPTSATRHAGNDTYVSKVDTYDIYGRELSTSTTLPASQPQLCAAAGPSTCTYTTTTAYRPNGSVNTVALPAIAGLPAETLTFGYSDVGDPGSLYAGSQTYVGTVKYSKTGQLTERHLGNSGKRVAMIYDYDAPTQRLKSLRVVPELQADAASYAYTHDDSGNLEKITDLAGTANADSQCFGFDYLQRLTEAWTPSSGDCKAAKTAGTLGGPAPYWHSWEIDNAGNRRKEIQHAATNTEYTYTYPAYGALAVRPHAVTNVTASGAASWSRNYSYDNGGNTSARPSSTGTAQALTYDPEGHLATLTEGTGTTNYTYGADGSRLIRQDPNGSKTLYLPSGDEVRFDSANSTTTATRYYAHGGTTIGMRTAAGVSWITGDHHGTAEITIAATTLNVAKRRSTPYGGQRGTVTGTWAAGMDKGFVGGTKDPTGLTHLGAREYDPAIGRFITVDPIMSADEPNQFSPYQYALNNPVNKEDRSGLKAVDPDSGASPLTFEQLVIFDGYLAANRVGTKHVLANGTTVETFGDGTVKINGYRLPPGYTDIRELAGFIDANHKKLKIDSEGKLARQAMTMRLIHKACAAGAGCQTDSNFDKHLKLERSTLEMLHIDGSLNVNQNTAESDEIAEAGGIRAYLDSWAKRMKADLDKRGIAGKSITVAVGVGAKDGKIVIMVAASGDTTIERVKKMGIALPAGAIDVGGKLHAEVNIGEYARKNGIINVAIGPSKPACPMCSYYTDVFRMRIAGMGTYGYSRGNWIIDASQGGTDQFG